MDLIYLDNNSTTRICSAAVEAMNECFAAGLVNPASQHRPGQAARKRLEEIREDTLRLLGAEHRGMQTDRLIYTSGGTESNNLALRGLCGEPPGRILVSAIEHPSVLGAADFLATQGFTIERLPVDRHGVVSLEALASALEQPVRFVSLMLANNETGALQPVVEAARICREAGVLLHTDAVQGIGKAPVSFRQLGVDAMTFTAHKFHGPRGIGGLIVRSGIEVRPILFGGFQQMAERPGTEDVALCAGLHAALNWLLDSREENTNRMAEHRDSLEQLINTRCGKAVCNSGEAARVPHTLNVSFLGINRQAFLMAADLAGLAVSTGSACASGSSDPSHVITAMTDDPDVIGGSIRISLSVQTTADEIAEAGRRIIKICKDLRAQN